MFLPEPQRRGEIHFWVAKFMPYRARLLAAFICLAAGFALQLALSNALTGAAFLLAASLLTLVKGYTNLPGALKGNRQWRTGEKDQLLKILDVARRARAWDQSVVDITCVRGLAALLLIAIPFIGLSFYLHCHGRNDWLASVLVLDAAALLLPHWVTGVRKILTNAPLTVKVANLLRVYQLWEKDRTADEAMVTQIEVQTAEKGEMPVDAKLVLRLPALGDAFLGVQIQVVLNNVQGKDYPYLYCVLVSRNELQMRTRLSPRPPSGIVTEWQNDDGMDILVIRQATSRTSGYHTDSAAITRIFQFTLAQARALLR